MEQLLALAQISDRIQSSTVQDRTEEGKKTFYKLLASRPLLMFVSQNSLLEAPSLWTLRLAWGVLLHYGNISVRWKM